MHWRQVYNSKEGRAFDMYVKLERPRAIEVHDGVVYDTDTAERLHSVDLITVKHDLAVTPEGHFCEIYMRHHFIVFIEISIKPLDRLAAVEWAVSNHASDKVLGKLGVIILREHEASPDKPEVSEATVVIARNEIWKNRMISWVELLCCNPDGRLFRYDKMRFFNMFSCKERRVMTQYKALRWAFKHGAPRRAYRHLGGSLDCSACGRANETGGNLGTPDPGHHSSQQTYRRPIEDTIELPRSLFTSPVE